ncbi:MAG: phospholipase A [Xanthomonadales bacterium]|nr:phospholipase A [Xanthomonadales bacterium]
MNKQNSARRNPSLHRHRAEPAGRPIRRRSSGHGLAAALATVLGLASLAAQAQDPAALEQCHAIADAGERLACYDRVSGRADPAPDAGLAATPTLAHAGDVQPGGEQTAAASGEEQPSILDAAWRLTADSDRYPISMYHANYILPLRYTNRANDQPFSPVFDAANIPDQNLDAAEAKFQLSLKARFWTTEDRRWGLWLAYTQQNQWQLYNSEISRPFRETNYMPEVFASWRPDLQFAGFDWKLLNFGFNHQSNGRADPLSRSWDRIFAEVGLERGKLAMMLRAWTRLEESADEDDNPDITDYYGHTELNALYRWGGNSLALMGRVNFDTGKGAVQAGWFSAPLIGPLRGYVQVFSGYGESMIDYNWNQTTIGIGLALSDGL